MHAPLLAIDLGTTNSLAALWRDGASVLVPNALGEVLTPSAVWVDEQGHALVGRAARDRWLLRPECGAVAFKRHMGTPKALQLGARSFRAEELSALVLKSLHDDAQRWLGCELREAVISVPAYFNNAQREATRQAALLAGLQVRRLVNEPTAAALAYGLHETETESTSMVLDLGGGTFDVSILERFDGVMEVRASTGDNQLGGEDFVEALVQHVLRQWPALPPRELHPRLQAALWKEAERVKLELNQRHEVDFTLEWDGQTHRCTINAQTWLGLCEPLLVRLRRPIERALHDAKLQASDLHSVVLAGGATRMTVLRQMVVRLFGRLPTMHLNPDEVIAQGAAVLAGLLDGDQALREVVMTDVAPHTLGTDVNKTLASGLHASGYFDPIIDRNTVVPASRERTYITACDQQRAVAIGVYQGEGRRVEDNLSLGRIELPVPPRPAGEVAVKVRFTYDASGILEVQAEVQPSGERKTLLLQQGPNGFDEQELQARVAKLAALKLHPRDEQINQALLACAERFYTELAGAPRELLANALAAFDDALEQQSPEPLALTRRRLVELLARLGSGESDA